MLQASPPPLITNVSAPLACPYKKTVEIALHLPRSLQNHSKTQHLFDQPDSHL